MVFDQEQSYWKSLRMISWRPFIAGVAIGGVVFSLLTGTYMSIDAQEPGSLLPESLTNLFSWNKSKAQETNYEVFQVEGVTPLVQDLAVQTTVAGALRASQSVVIRPAVDGKILSLEFKEGDLVKKGDVLVILENGAQKARVKQAKAQLALRQSDYDRVSALFKKEIVAQKDYDKALAEMKMAEAELDGARDQLEKTIIKAPFSGLVGLADVSVGAYVRAAEDLVSLHNIDPIQVEFRISEGILQDVHEEQIISVDVDGFGESVFEGVVTAIDTKVDPLTHSILVRADISNPDAALRPGLFAKVTIDTATHEDAILVPETAIQLDGDQEYVIIDHQGSIARVDVETGLHKDGLVEVRSGLEGLTEHKVMTSGGLVPPGAPVEWNTPTTTTSA